MSAQHTKTATAAVAELDTMQAALIALHTCKCCGARLDTYIQSVHPKSSTKPHSFGTCRTVGCDRKDITRELHVLAAFTDDDVNGFKRGKTG